MADTMRSGVVGCGQQLAVLFLAPILRLHELGFQRNHTVFARCDDHRRNQHVRIVRASVDHARRALRTMNLLRTEVLRAIYGN